MRLATRLMFTKSMAGSARLREPGAVPLVASEHASNNGSCDACAHSSAAIQPGSGAPARAYAKTTPSAPAACNPRAAAAATGSRAAIEDEPIRLPAGRWFLLSGASFSTTWSSAIALSRSPGSRWINVAASNASRAERAEVCLRPRLRDRIIRACSSRSLLLGRSGFSDKLGDLEKGTAILEVVAAIDADNVSTILKAQVAF